MDLLLHHFDASPFAEKIRLVFGIKNLMWGSVEIPMIMPKPALMPLTGGYRKTPVLQMGAEIYCDTVLIMEHLDRCYPKPPLHPSGPIFKALASWSDKTFFEPGAGLSMALNSEIPEPILTDRKAFFQFMDFDKLKTSVPHMYSQFLAQVTLLEQQLQDGRDYILGNSVCATDILCFFPLWMARGNVPEMNTHLIPYKFCAAWEQRMQAIGHGNRLAIAPEQALDIAHDHTPGEGEGVHSNDFKMEQRVNVTPTDYGAVPVTGQLITLNNSQITLRREHDRVGEVNTHFPRSGFEIKAVAL